MTSLEQAMNLIGRLTRGEKARLVRDIVSQLDESFLGIDTRPKSSSRSATTKPPEDCRFVAKLYTNENVPLPVAEELRRLGHDVMTVQESGLGGQSVPDHSVLTFAIDQGRGLITLNRRHFVKTTKGLQGIQESSCARPTVISYRSPLESMRSSAALLLLRAN